MTNNALTLLEPTQLSMTRRACGDDSFTRYLGLEYNGRSHVYCRCNNCLSIQQEHWIDDELGGYERGRRENDLGLKTYVELLAGISSLLKPLMRVCPNFDKDLLEIGCGFGYTLDVWNMISKSRVAKGVELASYGYWGKELLDADIAHELLADCHELSGTKWGLVFSAETLEHVPNPKSFIGELSEKLSDEGVLVLTTPAADFVDPSKSVVQLLPTLFPDGHQSVFSKKGLKDLLQGFFTNVNVIQENETLVAYASNQDIVLLDDASLATEMSARYIDYLNSALSQQLDNNNVADKDERAWLIGGLAFRLIREYVHLGLWENASRVYGPLRQMILESYEIDTDSTQSIEQTIRPLQERNEMIKRIPSYLGPLLYYVGMLNLNTGSFYNSINYFLGSYQCCKLWVELAPSIAGEASALIRPNLQHISIASKYLEQGLPQQS